MSDFDPDAYLQRKGIKVPPPEAPPDAPRMSDADVDAYLAEMARRRATPQVNPWETYASRGADALPLGRPIVNGLSAAILQGARALGVGEPGAQLTPEARGKLMAMGEFPQEALNTIPGLLGSYRDVRDTRDFRSDVGSEQNLRAAGLGTATGIIATALAPLPKSLGGAGGSTGAQALRAAANGGRGIGAAARTGALAGGLQAAGDSRADLTQPTLGGVLHQALDTGLGTVAGALGGAVGYGMGKAAPPLLRLARRKLEEAGIVAGRRALLSGADSLSNRELGDGAVREAIKSNAILPFGTVQGAAKRLEDLVESRGEVYGSIVQELEKRGVRGPDAAELTEKLIQRAQAKAPQTMDDALVDVWTESAKKVKTKAGEEATLGLTQAENLKRSLQQKARYGRTEETPLNEEMREIASVFRQANEDAIEAAAADRPLYGELQELAENFVPVKQQLGRTLEAAKAARRGAQKANNRGGGVNVKDIGMMALSPDAGTGAAAVMAQRFLGPRVSSSIASTSYWSSEVARALANGAAVGNARGTLPAAAARFGIVAGRESAPVLPESEEEQKARALAAALRRRAP